jgi:phosphatidylethanolamine/phosphatidyl-N-methylethanolamine N-methyltransferase
MPSSRSLPESRTVVRTAIKSPSLADVVRTYGAYAPVYDGVFGALLEPGRRALKRTVAALEPPRLLEIGVGTGLTLAGFPATTRVVGIDVSREMLERARQRAAALPGRDIELHEMNAEQTTFDDASFDCVVLPYVLSVTPSPQRLLREARRVCVPGGRIIVLNHFSGSPYWRLLEKLVQSAADRIGFRSDFDYDEHIGGHDWNVESVTSVNLLGLSKLVVIRA